MGAEKRGGIGGFFCNIFFPAEYSGHSPGHTLGHATLSSLGAASAKCCLSSGHTHNPGRGLCGGCPSPTGGSVPLSPTQTVATLSVLGTRRVVFILGVENQAVSLAACHLLQVMFDALKEGVKKGFRGKEGAIIVGEWQ